MFTSITLLNYHNKQIPQNNLNPKLHIPLHKNNNKQWAAASPSPAAQPAQPNPPSQPPHHPLQPQQNPCPAGPSILAL